MVLNNFSKAIFGMVIAPLPGAYAQEAVRPIDIGPIQVEQDVLGIKVQTELRANVVLTFEQSRVVADVVIEARLGDLQRKFSGIVDRFQLPTENCRSYSANNPVVSLAQKELRSEANSGLIVIAGSVTMWDCRENPIPNSKVEWEIKKVGPIKTKVPKVVTWKGDPIKNKLLTQPFTSVLRVYAHVYGRREVGLRIGDPQINLTGRMAFITKGVLSIAGVNINDKAKSALDKALPPERLKFVLPEKFYEYDPEVVSAHIGAKHEQLTLTAHMRARVTPEQVAALVASLRRR